MSNKYPKLNDFLATVVTWRSAWTPTVVWVLLFGASAPSTLAITPSSFHHQVSCAYYQIYLGFHFPDFFCLTLNSLSEVEANPALWLTAVSQYKVFRFLFMRTFALQLTHLHH